MTDSIKEQVAKALQAAVETISQANGYEFDLADNICKRPTRFGKYEPKHLRAVLFQDDEEAVDLEAQGHNEFFTVFRTCILLAPEESENGAIDELINNVGAALFKAVSAKVVLTPPLGVTGCVNAVMLPLESLLDDSGLEGVWQPVRCHIQHLFGDPFSA